MFLGMLLRFFVHFYDMEIIEEEAFLAWKEDITQEFPGKGKALFQVDITFVKLILYFKNYSSLGFPESCTAFWNVPHTTLKHFICILPSRVCK